MKIEIEINDEDINVLRMLAELYSKEPNQTKFGFSNTFKSSLYRKREDILLVYEKLISQKILDYIKE
jgi:hypothetical protein